MKHAHELARRKKVLPLLELGKLYLGQKKYRLAAEALRKAHALDGSHEEVLFRRAQAFLGRDADNTYFYLYRDSFPNGRFTTAVNRVIGPPAGSTPLPVDIR